MIPELVELRKKLKAKADAQNETLAKARKDDGSYDASLVKMDAVKFQETIVAGEKEIADIESKIEPLAELERAELAAKRRSERGPDPVHRHPEGDKGDPDERRIKSFADLVTGDDAWKEWAEALAEGKTPGTLFRKDFADVWPSEVGALGIKTLFETSAGWAPESIRLGYVVPAVDLPPQVIDIIPGGRTGQAAVPYMEETTRTHAAAEKAEGAAFAESTFALTEQSKTVRKITDSVPVTDEQLADVPQVESYLRGRMVYGVRKRLGTQIIGGNDVAPNLDGLSGATGLQTQALGADDRVVAIRKAKTKVMVTGEASPTHVALHPTDWESIETAQLADGQFLLAMAMSGAPKRLWSMGVVEDGAALSQGTGYVGAFSPEYCMLFERQGVEVLVGFVNDDFSKGKQTIRATMRAAMVWFRGAAFCSVTGL